MGRFGHVSVVEAVKFVEGHVLVTVEAKPSTPLFDEMWGPFLSDFVSHLREKGWLEITNIAADERSPEEMAEVFAQILRSPDVSINRLLL